jgi:hypothetical protein
MKAPEFHPPQGIDASTIQFRYSLPQKAASGKNLHSNCGEIYNIRAKSVWGEYDASLSIFSLSAFQFSISFHFTAHQYFIPFDMRYIDLIYCPDINGCTAWTPYRFYFGANPVCPQPVSSLLVFINKECPHPDARSLFRSLD